jgi:peptidoglycan/xylan/chitin deacetylase (PgdA/CDA1 family)
MTHRRAAKPLGAVCVSVLGRAVRATRAGRLLVLIYHRVRPQPDAMFPNEVDATAFDWQMRLLQQHCVPMALSDAVPKLRSGRLSPRTVAVTFDDGYADNSEVALPILLHHGVPATFFVAPAFLDGGRMWNDSIIEALRRATVAALDLTGFGQGVVPLGTEAERGQVAETIIRSVKHLRPFERQDRVNSLCEHLGVILPDDMMMSSAQLRKLADTGMEIGAHTMTHPILSTLPAEKAHEEIENSRKALEEIIRRPVHAFAYPNGRPGQDYTDRDRDMVQSLGFEYALSTRLGVAWQGSDLFQLPRFTPWDQTPTRWLARLLWAFRNAI